MAGCLLLGGMPVHANAEEELGGGCKAAYACDFVSGTPIYSKNETERLPIASMCKIMTLLLSFEAVDRGELQYDEQITVSENASGMGGSQVYLDTGLSYSAEELMKTVAVCSANDSCVALAERVAGSESAFVERMNVRARELGAENTLFANCTGLPKEPQYSCAKDVSTMLREMLSHEKYFEFSRIWLEDFAHPDGRTTQITNTNKLIRSYNGCDGGKTGFTSEAGFCLAATAKRGETRLVSVVIGAESSKGRFGAISDLFDFGFGNYENKVMLEAGKPLEERVSVRGGKVKDIAVAVMEPLCAFCKKGTTDGHTIQYTFHEDLRAPILAGDEVGEAVLYLQGVEICRCKLVSLDSVEKRSWWDSFRDTARDWQ